MTAEEVAASHPFETDFGDHFATDAAALRHVAPVLRWLDVQQQQGGGGGGDGGGAKRQTVIYDPFYCDGSIKRRLAALGFPRCVHENRDFYADVAARTVPEHGVLVTNPPYSGDHKARILEFALTANERRPFALLVPAYCVAKAWYVNTPAMDTSEEASEARRQYIQEIYRESARTSDFHRH